MRLIDAVDFVFSKNAGPFVITFDIRFKDAETYRAAVDAEVLSREIIADLFKISPDRVLSIYAYDAGQVIKFSLRREIPSGSFGDRTVFGSQLWAPLIDLEIPEPSTTSRH